LPLFHLDGEKICPRIRHWKYKLDHKVQRLSRHNPIERFALSRFSTAVPEARAGVMTRDAR
jgi:hypothetical protein